MLGDFFIVAKTENYIYLRGSPRGLRSKDKELQSYDTIAKS